MYVIEFSSAQLLTHPHPKCKLSKINHVLSVLSRLVVISHGYNIRKLPQSWLILLDTHDINFASEWKLWLRLLREIQYKPVYRMIREKKWTILPVGKQNVIIHSSRKRDDSRSLAIRRCANLRSLINTAVESFNEIQGWRWSRWQTTIN